jgi:Zn-dependent protease
MEAQVFIFVLVGWIFSVCLHEFGHAIVAYRFGDYSVKEKGYLTMNPLYYAHPVLSVAMPVLFMLLGGIGLPGGAVYIDDSLIRGKWRRALVSLAGPAMNLVFAILLSVPFWFGWVGAHNKSVLPHALALLVYLQICAVLFNLLPIPSLDGFRALSEWLPQNVREFAWRHGHLFLFGFIVLLWRVEFLGMLFEGVLLLICTLLGIDVSLIVGGWREFRFWDERG